MKKAGLCLLAGLLSLIVAGTALAAGLPGMDALIQLATSSKPTPLKLPDVFEITYRTQDGEVSLSRGADGTLTAVRGEETFRYLRKGDDAYQAETGETLTLDEVKAAIAFVWDLIEPSEQVESAAIIAIYDGNTKIAGREANRFRETLHQGDGSGYSVEASGAVWYTFDKKTGVCLAKETAPDENHENAEVLYECLSYKD